jgi:hypothetical protein
VVAEAHSSPLSTYPWAAVESSPVPTLESCIQDIVKHLDAAPFLEVVYTGRRASFDRIPVPQVVANVPQVKPLQTA